MNSVEMKRNKLKTSLLPYLSANFLDKPIPKIIKIIPPALKRPKPADSGSAPKKLTPIPDKKSKIGLMKFINRSLST